MALAPTQLRQSSSFSHGVSLGRHRPLRGFQGSQTYDDDLPDGLGSDVPASLWILCCSSALGRLCPTSEHPSWHTLSAILFDTLCAQFNPIPQVSLGSNADSNLVSNTFLMLLTGTCSGKTLPFRNYVDFDICFASQSAPCLKCFVHLTSKSAHNGVLLLISLT